MKLRLLLMILAATLAACDSQKKAEQEAAQRQLEERVAAAEKERVQLVAARDAEAAKRAEAERKAADVERNAALTEAARLENERQRLQQDLEKLQAENAKLAAKQKKELEGLAGEALEKRLKEQRMEVEAARAKAEEEQRKLEVARAKADAERVAAERATAEAVAREEATTRAQEIARTQTTMVFFNALDSAGEWFDSDRYGFVWRPYAAVKDSAWRPYADGHWIYTVYGWTWMSNEPFGWAVYHYGRWIQITGTGWVWVPGSDWAPAWVAWRWHRPREYIGWAPLPPEAQNAKGIDVKVDQQYDIGPGSYAFIPMGDFDAPSYLDKFVPGERNKEILPLTSNMTYIVPKAGGGMICGGPDMSFINSEIRRLRNDLDIKPVARVGIQLMNSPAPSAAPDVMNAGAVMYFAPQLKAGPPPGKPEKLKGRIEVKNADRGWNPANPWETNEWRKRLKADADAIDAAERAAANRPPPRPPTPAATPVPGTTPAPQPVIAPPPRPRPGGLQGSQLQPSGGLFPRR